MIRVTAYKDGKPVYSEEYGEEAKDELEAKIRLINGMYWNYISCGEASEIGWYNEYTYICEVVKGPDSPPTIK